MDQSRLDLRGTARAGAQPVGARPVVGAARSAIRFEPPKLTSIGGGRISRSTAEVGALAEAREQGRAEALAELDATIERHRRATEDMQAASRALVDALHQIQRADVDRIHDLERQVLELGLAVAEEIVGREVAADQQVVLTSAERALALEVEGEDQTWILAKALEQAQGSLALAAQHEIAEIVIVAVEIRSDFGIATRSTNRHAKDNPARVTVVEYVVQFVSGCFGVRIFCDCESES